MTANQYEAIAAKLGFPGSANLMNILKYLITPEQARMIEVLPGSPEDVAEKTGISTTDVENGLKDLFLKGVVFPRGSSGQYRFARSVLQLHDASQASAMLDPVKDKHFFELWHAFGPELYPFMVKVMGQVGQPPMRVVPAYNAIKNLPDIQPWENFIEIIKSSDPIAVTPCPCRFQTTAINEPCAYSDETAEWKCLQLGRGAEYVISRGSGKQITREDALKLVEKIEDEALVHIWDYYATMDAHMSCQCCQDCCIIFQSMEHGNGNLETVYARSRFRAFLDQESCSGCQNCLERCQFNAIDLVRVGKKYKAVVDQEKCWGCGVCVLKCEPGAIYLEAVEPVEYIPAKS